MKNLRIATRKQANEILLNSLFKVGQTYSEQKLCTGKYKKTPTQMVKDELSLDVSDNTHAIYGIRRSDSYGSYTQLMAIMGL